ncbi:MULTISPECIES: DUF2934 domain-containing protein [Rhizobium]|uniref:DUF2934 domain-containing protein n=1 Tax=Rhizobium leguminosarum TaxID=384 RepID=A0AAJ1ER47_RHILE|nr:MULTISPECIES: DUF2934 domain-containing protein [Rhizobium]MBY3049791.1 DUF2934 domain-containing protein [Rhizobium laguerreae]MBY3120431.1 DUF2934 domain-containing protein [Rhizobium laguerreae]MBY3192411.1 DUF2934 domain-containing protein [Rhizobium laguerreae]MBY3203641.1 DUF2934 domain-containing protein [Rhizobium laguerreae]MBY3206446.1 DUF2934 domain-containing protein [Rhizobium laguerreae]
MEDRDRENRIRERAHQIWEREGGGEGNQERHWEQATREIDAENAAAGEGDDGKTGSTGSASGLQGGGTSPGGGPASGVDSMAEPRKSGRGGPGPN